MRNLLSRLFGGTSPTAKSLRHAAEAAEIARLQGIANEPPPPGEGWRCGAQDSEGKWTVWNGARKIASFWDENDAAAWARLQNADKGPLNPAMREDGKYCVNCGSHETDESLKARGYVSCCPERYAIPELWHVTDGRLATGQFHLWQPVMGLETLTDDSWADRPDAQHEADHRNLLAFRNVVLKPAALAMGGQNSGFRPSTPEMSGYVEALDATRPAQATGKWPWEVADESGASAGFAVESLTDPLRETISNPRIVIEPKDPERARIPQSPALYMQVAGRIERPRAATLAEFLNVPIPDGVRQVVGPLKSPQDGNWWTFDRSGPVRGYTRKTNAQLAADRANNAPQT